LAFENAPASKDLMRRPPRRLDAPTLMEPVALWASLVAGGLLLLMLMGWAAWMLFEGHAPEQTRTAVLGALTSGNVALAAGFLSVGTRLRLVLKGPMVVVACAAAGVLGLGLAWEPARQLLGLQVLAPLLMGQSIALGGLAAALGLAVAWWLERRAQRRQPPPD
jgi:hypothetical protein